MVFASSPFSRECATKAVMMVVQSVGFWAVVHVDVVGEEEEDIAGEEWVGEGVQGGEVGMGIWSLVTVLA